MLVFSVVKQQRKKDDGLAHQRQVALAVSERFSDLTRKPQFASIRLGLSAFDTGTRWQWHIQRVTKGYSVSLLHL